MATATRRGGGSFAVPIKAVLIDPLVFPVSFRVSTGSSRIANPVGADMLDSSYRG
jgi:hypothetical protein